MKPSVFFIAFLPLFVVTTTLHAQDRDLRAERLVLDDNGADSTANTVTIRASQTLGQNLILRIPDPGSGTAEFMLTSGSAGYWRLGGNGGTVPGINFLGTTDSTAVRLHVRGGSGTIANSLILNENGSLQRDSAGNMRGLNAVDLQIARSAATAVAASDYSVIVGGQNNGIAASADYSTIGGGLSNAIRDNAIYSAIGGGALNTIDTNAQYAGIGAGRENTVGAGATYSTIGGGYLNAIDSGTTQATIGGGRENRIWSGADNSTISGGIDNSIEFGSDHSTIAGGEGNTIFDSARYSTIIGGITNRIRDGADYAVISGGQTNNINIDADEATIGGGRSNSIGAHSEGSSIGGGRSNSIHDNVGYAVIEGGSQNIISLDADYSTIGGGLGNIISGKNSTIPGGRGLRLNGDGSFGFLANAGSNDMIIAESAVAVFGNADLWLANNTGTASQIRFYEAHTTAGAFPGSDYYTSFEAPPLGDTIAYILPGVKPTQVGQVLQVSAINGDTITLTWGTDSTIAGRDGSDVPFAIGAPDDGSHLESGMRKLEEQLEAREQLLEAREKQIRTLCAAVQTLEKKGAEHSSDRVESKENASTQNAE